MTKTISPIQEPPLSPLLILSSNKIPEDDVDSLIDMAAEQFARLLWEQVSYKKNPPINKRHGTQT